MSHWKMAVKDKMEAKRLSLFQTPGGLDLVETFSHLVQSAIAS